MFDDDDKRVYQVVINGEEQYSIWPADRDIPAGWQATGPAGVRSECLAYIDEVWTDMRPRSVRLAMGEEPSTHPTGGTGRLLT